MRLRLGPTGGAAAAADDDDDSGAGARYDDGGSGAGNALPIELGMNPLFRINPFSAPETILEGRAITQEQLFFNTLNFDSSRPNKTELGNSFRTLLSPENYHLPNSRLSLAKLPVNKGSTVNMSSCTLPITTIPPLAENQRNSTLENIKGLSLLTSSRSLSMLKSSVLQSTLTEAGPSTHGMDCIDVISNQPSRAHSTNTATSSLLSDWPNSANSNNAIKVQTSNFQPSQKFPVEIKSSSSSHASAFGKGPLVFCMTTVGELFVNEMGLLGVICCCHKLRMSVAKFCEHSGASSDKPGDFVCMENGMTISQWRKYHLGIMAPDDGKTWHWPDGSFVLGGLIESKAANLSNLRKEPQKSVISEAPFGLGKNVGPRCKSAYRSQPYREAVDQTTAMKITNEKSAHGQQKSNFEEQNIFSTSFPTNFSSLTQRTVPPLAKNLIAQERKGSPVHMGAVDSSTVNNGGQKSGSLLASNSVNLMGKCNNSSISYQYSGTKDNFIHDNKGSEVNFPGEVSRVSRKGASNFELQLGQPSQLNHTTAGLFPNSMCIVRFGAVHDPQKSRAHQPLANGNNLVVSAAAVCPKETTRSRQNTDELPTETSFSTRRHMQHPLGMANFVNSSETEELNTDSTKNSLISLFLSHLERNNTSQAADDILTGSEHFPPRLLNDDTYSAKCNLSDSIVNENDRNERKCVMNKLDLSQNRDGASEPSSTKSSVVKSSYFVQSKQISDDRTALASTSGVHPPQSNFYAHDKLFPLHSNQCGEVLGLENGNYFDYVNPKSQNPLLHASVRSGSLIMENGGGASEPTSLKNKSDPDIIQHLTQENLRVHSFRPAVEFSKQENFTTFHETSTHHGRLCCLSTVKMKGNYGQNDVSRVAVRSEYPCPHFHCNGGGVEMPAGNPNFACSKQHCNCTATIQRASLCFRQNGIQCPACHVCATDEQPCIRCTRPSNICLPANEGQVYACPGEAYEKDCTFRDSKRIRLGNECGCSKSSVVVNNDNRNGFCKDTRITEEFGAYQEFDSVREQNTSKVSSGSSAPAITEVSVSVETNNMGSSAKEDMNTFHNCVDEGSGIEKCGSSDEAIGGTECEQALSDKLNLDNSSRIKQISNQITMERAQEVTRDSNCCIGKVQLLSSQEIEASPRRDNDLQKICLSSAKSSNVKRKRSSLSCTKLLPIKRNTRSDKIVKDDEIKLYDEVHSHDTPSEKSENDFDRKRVFRQKELHVEARKLPKYMLLSCIGKDINHGRNFPSNKGRPVVCGNSGIISTGIANGEGKPAKILPLSLILKKARRLSTPKHGKKLVPENRNTRTRANKRSHNALTSWKSLYSTEGSGSGLRDEAEFLKPTSNQLSPTSKDIHECRLNKLSKMDRKSKISIGLPPLEESGSFDQMEAGKDQLVVPPITRTGEKHQSAMLASRKISKCALSTDIKSVRSLPSDHSEATKHFQVNSSRYDKGHKVLLDSDAFCCVCSGSNQENINRLIECSQCFIKVVHQACYGVPRVPRGCWSCRPCKMNVQDIACVLCGYGGGAMTRAVKSQKIVKSLLKRWEIGNGSNLKFVPPSTTMNAECDVKVSSFDEASEHRKYGFIPPCGTISSNVLPSAGVEINLKQTNETQQLGEMPSNFETFNSIIAGLFDPTVTQWVHMVCGLWTPGTRCPNVDTMSAFDVSGASPARKNALCSMCNRPGGSCIMCRVSDCFVVFHPWCAHQKGLLQSEVEGDDDDKVGFYGRCLNHAVVNISDIDSHHVDPEEEFPIKGDWTCARTEGPEKEEGFNLNYKKSHHEVGGCIVSQEQINAWLHINGPKSVRGVLKPLCLDVEYDFRKEYIRYKQSKGWKHLVVYKSGIHALGLYTSQFIARGAMVIQHSYVVICSRVCGEIVGLRVADKREIEYQSGRRLQYKSACYFFRIDKEHIIDATRKGGIARFVNHSCQPNCVAKVISIRNEKKVVFFAERDINPGEEITYDYHFNHEDEGHKIPCFCNSKNCRRYLN
uniref:Uncharacterized protein n=1 Tax=Ananas comosus var. bracteatus TaxID=296719 RepID=A0A6V7PM22_ANACO|nr:unnamed protein product [Ananas comosus var. bracteatus]